MEKKRNIIEKLAKFGIVGVIATLIDFVILYLLKSLLGINVYISVSVAFAVSLLFNYLASMKYVFVAREGLTVSRQVFIFLSTAVAGLLLNELIMWICITFSGLYYMLGKVLATVVVMVFNYITRSVLLE